MHRSIQRGLEEEKSEDRHSVEEAMLARVQEGGDVEKDLRVLFWQTPEELEQVLIETVVADMEADTKLSLDPEKPYLLWNQALTRNGEPFPEASQVISPYRGNLHGIEHIDQVLQIHKNRWWVAEKGAIGGITVFDKVVQVRNRPKSNPISAQQQ